MDNIESFDVNIDKWAKPLNLYIDGVIKSIVRNVETALADSASGLGKTCSVLPFGSQYFDSAISQNTPLDIYVVNTKEYYYDVESTVDTSLLDLPTSKIDYEKFKTSVYKDMQKYFGKYNVGLLGNTIHIKKEQYKIHLKPVASYHAYTNVLDKNADTVVSFIEGVALPKKDESLLIYYPYHEEKNYHTTNRKTDNRFNAIVRVIKHLSDWISRKDGYSTMMPSYLLTCLAYNVPNVVIKRMSGYDAALVEIIDYLYDMLITDLYKDMYEINDIKLLFSSKQTWNRDITLNFLQRAKHYIKYIV